MQEKQHKGHKHEFNHLTSLNNFYSSCSFMFQSSPHHPIRSSSFAHRLRWVERTRCAAGGRPPGPVSRPSPHCGFPHCLTEEKLQNFTLAMACRGWHVQGAWIHDVVSVGQEEQRTFIASFYNYISNKCKTCNDPCKLCQ